MPNAKGLGYSQNRRVYGHRLCLLFSQISISADRDVPAFSKAGTFFPCSSINVNCGMFPRGILKGIGCVQSPSNLFFIKLHLLQLIAQYHTCMKQNDAKQPGHLTAQAVCSAGRTYSCQESIEEYPLFQGCRSSLAELAINHSKQFFKPSYCFV